MLGSRADFDRTTHGRTKSVVGGGEHAFVLAADFRSRADNAAGKRHDRIGDCAHGVDRRLSRAQRGLVRAAHEEKVAAADSVADEAGRRLAQKLAVHDWDAPEMPAVADTL